MSVDALFVDAKGIYPRLLGAEHCWDEKRDARTYAGEGPVVTHPPCARWCKLAKVNQRRWGFMVGEDGGLFERALTQLVYLGGVLEHPAGSLAFDHFGIDRPKAGKGWQQIRDRIWVCEVWQSAYGHKCHKKTWLIYVGARPPFDLDFRRDKALATRQIGGGINTGFRSLPRLPDGETHLTPERFARELIKLAEWSRG